ncbi:RHS repeat-associated core domain-containing protein [Prevotella melaninogenica]|uniref:RHS repeat-associated core domain-containing protein n=1 Tax=Prevotella melaninogenica TaxID=28132 RepID=UPI001CAC8838|nr:RHS repeat-associated core domain-containing protein [Prevotella melaninogenica]MBF1610682.1 RHS repeat protein [Prevotella sp.]
MEDELGVRERYEYTEYYEVYREWDGEGRMTGYCYDERGNLTSVIHPDGTEETRAYDEEDRLITETDALGNRRVLVYHEPSQDGTPVNGEGQLSAVIEADDRATFFEYDTHGLLSSVSLDDRTVHLEYNEQNNLVSVKNEKGVGTRWNYDHKGNVLSVLTSAGAKQTFRYDRLNRVTSITTGKRTTNLRYNSYEDVVEASEGFHRVKYKYSPMGDILQREGEDGSVLRFAYDRMDRLRMLTNEHGEEYTFDRNLRGEIVGETGFDRMHRKYMRDRSGRVIREERAGGRWTEYEYDQRGRLTRSSFSDGTIEAFSYDVLGRLTEARNATGSVSMEYDEGGRVVKECFSGGLPGDKGTTVENIYDDLGNRIETRTSLGSVVQKAHLEEELGITFRAFGAGWRYDWQSDGMLSRVVRPDSKEVSFAYDALGRRTEKTYEGVTTHFVWDGNVPLHEWQEVAADAGKADVTTWLFEQNTFIPAAKLAANGESFSIVSDYLGTPMQAFDNNGNKVWEQELDIFGRKKRKGNNNSSFIPFKYQGQYEDIETGLYYNRFRYYDSCTGNYISQDPIGLAGGNPTLYAYVKATTCYLDIFGWAVANGGTAPQHGGKGHDKVINEDIKQLRNEGATNIRKNQQQVDINGNTVGKNRPDVQFDKDGVHYNIEYDTTVKGSMKHQKEIPLNDPNSRNTFWEIDKEGNKLKGHSQFH